MQRISGDTAAATSLTFGTRPSVGDLIIVGAYRAASATPPSLPAGYIKIDSSGANTNSWLLAYKWSDGTETTTGVFTNATDVEAAVYRGIDQNAPIGARAVGGGSGTSITYPALTLKNTDGTSWVIGFGGNASAAASTAPTGMTAIGHQTNVELSDTNGGVASWSAQTVTGNTSASWRAYTLELMAATAAVCPGQVVQHVSLQSNENIELGNAFKWPLPNPTGAGNCLLVNLVYAHSVSRTVTFTDDGPGGNTYSVVAGPHTDGGSTFDAAIYASLNVPAGITHVTVTFDTAINDVACVITELSGIALASAADGSNHADSTSPVAPGAFTPTTNGDLIYQFAFDSSWGAGFEGTTVTGFRPLGGFFLFAPDLRIGLVAQCAIQTTAASINPSFATNNDATGGDSYSTLAVALKTDATKGTPGSGMRPVQVLHTRIAPGTKRAQFPTIGNLAAMMVSFVDGGITLSSVKDATNGSWTLVQPGAGLPQAAYVQNMTADVGGVLTVVSVDGGSGVIPAVLYDIVGANASAFDVSASASSGVATSTPANAPVIVPTTANGLVLAALSNIGPPTGLTSPSGAIYNAVVYTGQGDTSPADNGDGHAVYYNPSAGSIHFDWVDSVSTPNWAALAVAFKAPSGATRVPYQPQYFLAPAGGY